MSGLGKTGVQAPPEALPGEPIPAEANIPNAAGDSAHTLRKRARRACLYCRARKVRCNVSLDGQPCTNCRLDSRDCVVKPRARKWPCSQPPVQVFQLQQQAPQNVDVSVSAESYHPSSFMETSYAASQLDPIIPVAEDILPSELDSLPSEDTSRPTSFSRTCRVETDSTCRDPKDSDWLFGSSRPLTTNPPFEHKDPSRESALTTLTERNDEPFVLFSCYPFIEADTLGRLSSNDVAFLQQRGCFHLPARPALEEFVQQYFSHVHPILPVLDEAEFWRMTSCELPSSSEKRSMSLFLIQSILFISCPFVSLSTLQSLGFPSVQRARTELYSKAKALFDIDSYRDDLTSAQGALLLTYYAPSATDRTNTYWMNTAIHFARSARADQYSTMSDDTPNKSALKRLWWCCILRDRIMALGLRRPMCIRPTDFDFTLPGLTENDYADEIRDSKVYNSATKRVLVQLIVSLCELGVILNDILDIIYPMKAPSQLSYCQRSHEKLQLTSATLDSWYEKTVAKFATPTHVFGAHRSLILFTDMGYLYYFTAKAAVCNHMMLLSITGPELDDTQKDSRLQIQAAQLDESLRNITDLLKELQQLGLSKFLPNTFIAFSAFAFVWRMLDAELTSSGRRSDAVRKDLETYADVMNGFRSIYESTDSVLQCIEKTVDYIKLNEPLQVSYTPNAERRPINGPFVSQKQQARPVNPWAKLLDGNPRSYMRISLTVEFSLSRGQFPSENDFPKALQTLQRKHDYFSGYNALTELDDSVFYDLLEQALEAGQGA